MTEFIQSSETALRLGIFVIILLLMMAAETAFAKKVRVNGRAPRWASNFALVIIDSVLVRLLFPVAAAGAAIIATNNGWGLFNAVALPVWLEIILAVIILDMMIYWQHVASHKIPALWAIHKVHHADRDIDVTTGFRFHPAEIILSMGFKMLLVLLIGTPVIAVILFEIILSGCALFNHSNLRLPSKADRFIRKILVTPDMHRVHHSINVNESRKNYGFSVPLWDHLFKTYQAQPAAGHDNMVIGLAEHQGREPSSLLWSLLLPLKRQNRP